MKDGLPPQPRVALLVTRRLHRRRASAQTCGHRGQMSQVLASPLNPHVERRAPNPLSGRKRQRMPPGQRAPRAECQPSASPTEVESHSGCPRSSPELVPTEASWGQQAVVLAPRHLNRHGCRLVPACQSPLWSLRLIRCRQPALPQVFQR